MEIIDNNKEDRWQSDELEMSLTLELFEVRIQTSFLFLSYLSVVQIVKDILKFTRTGR